MRSLINSLMRYLVNLASVDPMKKISVTFLPVNRTVEVSPGTTVLEAARRHRFLINAPCGGKGQCGNCTIQVTGKPHPPITAEDSRHLSSSQLEQGYRLACCLTVNADLTVRLLQQEDTGRHKLGLLDLETGVQPDTGIRKVLFHPEKATLKNIRIPLAEALGRVLPPGRAAEPQSLKVVETFSDLLKKNTENLTLVLRNDTLTAVEEGDTRGRICGAAADIGTTTLAVFICDLEDGSILAGRACANSQSSFGEDVMSRIGYCMENPGGREELSRIVRQELSTLATEACREAGVETSQIYAWSMVGNTTMQHLFLGLDPACLGVSPFLPMVNGSVEFDPVSLGLAGSEFGRGVFLPTVAGHVGADTASVALAARLDECKGLTLAVDLGTNGEIVLADCGRLLCSSTAAGPAFEGAKIQMGMRAVPGAIDRFRIEEDYSVHCHVIGEETSGRGICGSGLLDSVSELLRVGLIDQTGRILPPEELKDAPAGHLADRLVRDEQGRLCFLVGEFGGDGRPHRIMISQQDIRELQLAIGAISSGIHIMLKLAGRKAGQVERVLLTGAFGNFLHPASAVGSGLIRGVPLERIHSIGNAAGVGARMALVSEAELLRAGSIAEHMEFVELAVQPGWQDQFAEAMIFPEHSDY
jgi:uncharacterized 2Fe-2S/4Fe-4S cluster protein (DUF4445 family)